MYQNHHNTYHVIYTAITDGNKLYSAPDGAITFKGIGKALPRLELSSYYRKTSNIRRSLIGKKLLIIQM